MLLVFYIKSPNCNLKISMFFLQDSAFLSKATSTQASDAVRLSVSTPGECHSPQFVSINLPVARHGQATCSMWFCNLLLMCCTLSLNEPTWSDCEQTEIPPMLSEQVLLMAPSIKRSPITACLQSPLNTLHQFSPDFSR